MALELFLASQKKLQENPLEMVPPGKGGRWAQLKWVALWLGFRVLWGGVASRGVRAPGMCAPASSFAIERNAVVEYFSGFGAAGEVGGGEAVLLMALDWDDSRSVRRRRTKHGTFGPAIGESLGLVVFRVVFWCLLATHALIRPVLGLKLAKQLSNSFGVAQGGRSIGNPAKREDFHQTGVLVTVQVSETAPLWPS
jgi:hypothetical protein